MARRVRLFRTLAIPFLFMLTSAQFTEAAGANSFSQSERFDSASFRDAISVQTLRASLAAEQIFDTRVRQSESNQDLKYVLQSGSPIWLQSFTHADCTWMGVAGQVFDASGNPLQALLLHVYGSLEGQPVDLLGITGGAIAYGPGGYEITLSQKVINSDNSLWIEVWDLNDQVLSDPIPFGTFADCSRNLVLINFVQEIFLDSWLPIIKVQPPLLNSYLPMIFVDSKIR